MKKVTTNSISIIAAKNGSKGLITLDTDTLATPAPTKRMVPTGGVHKPMQRLRTITIPKWTGSIPNCVTTGKKMGVKMRIAGVMSIKVPTTRSVRLISKKIKNGLLTVSSRKPVMSCGILSKENKEIGVSSFTWSETDVSVEKKI